MSKSERVRLQSVRQAFRLLGDVRDLQNAPELQRQVLIDGLIKLVDCQNGFIANIPEFVPGGSSVPSSIVTPTHFNPVLLQIYSEAARIGETRPDPFADRICGHGLDVEVITEHQILPERERSLYPLYAEFRPVYKLEDLIVSYFRTTPGGKAILGFGLHRLGRGQQRFRPRETKLIHVLMEELRWLYETGRLRDPGSAVEKLTPRQRQVLFTLLDGQSPKQIASSLNLSVHTVRDYIKAIYKAYDVNGRDELFAKFVKSGGHGVDSV